MVCVQADKLPTLLADDVIAAGNVGLFASLHCIIFNILEQTDKSSVLLDERRLLLSKMVIKPCVNYTCVSVYARITETCLLFL